MWEGVKGMTPINDNQENHLQNKSKLKENDKGQKAELEIFGSKLYFWWPKIIGVPFIIFGVLTLLTRLGVYNPWYIFEVINSLIKIPTSFIYIMVFLMPVILSIPFYVRFYKIDKKRPPIISLYDTFLTFQLESPKGKLVRFIYEIFIVPKFITVNYEDIERVFKSENIINKGYYVEGSTSGTPFKYHTVLYRINNDIEISMLIKGLSSKNVKNNL
ncbi:hypothetical protein Q4599_11110 [Cellulophaga lytica]|uniref:hypothetical protein n=1 Tax=Cellulophaga lytica TaxID=979 RepID=UPI0026E115F2|nr:hypothetical protein [Cellulophaga lytica]MDO6854128.1 hypothetical protein [Cellulophaga lytica]